jgi:hypothetical protein
MNRLDQKFQVQQRLLHVQPALTFLSLVRLISQSFTEQTRPDLVVLNKILDWDRYYERHLSPELHYHKGPLAFKIIRDTNDEVAAFYKFFESQEGKRRLISVSHGLS